MKKRKSKKKKRVRDARNFARWFPRARNSGDKKGIKRFRRKEEEEATLYRRVVVRVIALYVVLLRKK